MIAGGKDLGNSQLLEEDTMKWILYLLVIGIILSCADSIVGRIAGVAIVVGLSSAIIGELTDTAMFFVLMKACAVIIVVIVAGVLISAIVSD